MADVSTLTAEVRERAGKGAARATRRQGRVPAVIYGNKEAPMMISLDPRELQQRLKKPGFFSRVLELAVNGSTYRLLARDMQIDPVTGRPIHVDFMRFGADTRITIDVPVRFINDGLSPGIKRGGVLNVVRHTVEMVCIPEKIPENITVDLAGLDIGDSVHISAIELPKDVRLVIADRDFTIATIAAPSILTVEEEKGEAPAEVAEPTLVGEGAEGAPAQPAADAKDKGKGKAE